MRASSYIIYVDVPDNQREMLLVHGYTGAYDKVSRDVAVWLRGREERRPPKPMYGAWTNETTADDPSSPPSDNTVNILRRRGYLTEMSVDQEEEFFGKFVEKLHEIRQRTMPSYIFMPTYDCNLRCSYCFQDHMRTDPRYAHLLRRMDPEIVDRIFSSFGEIEALHQVDSGGRIPRSIGFFGGEPLLASNRSVVEHIMSKARALGPAMFWAVSNATDLDAYEDLLGPNGIARVQVTIDGAPEVHDQRRIYADGSGSFERIARNVTIALNRGASIDIRMNVDRNNLDQIATLARVIYAHNWPDYPNFSAYTAPIRDSGEPEPGAGLVKIGAAPTAAAPGGCTKGNGNGSGSKASAVLDTWELSQAQTELLSQCPEVGIFDHPNNQIKQQARQLFAHTGAGTPVLRDVFCSAHTGMYIFDAFGDIYTCWDKTGDASLRVGKVTPEGRLSLDEAAKHNWRSRTVASNPVCRKCRYALHCGGGCAVLALGKTGKLHMNYCDGFASRLRSGIASAWQDHVAGVPLEAHAARVCDQ